jgi:hypothetical protein
MRRLKSPCTVHGFRSAFRDWASERSNFAREICEAALAHIVKDKTEAAWTLTPPENRPCGYAADNDGTGLRSAP